VWKLVWWQNPFAFIEALGEKLSPSYLCIPCLGFQKPTIGLKGYTLKTLGRNIGQNQARDEEILPLYFSKKTLPIFFF
jgi:hypothetical protein